MIDNKPTWEEKQSLNEILEERASYAAIGKLNIWYAEKMCQALAEENRIFQEEDYRYYSPYRKEDLISRCNIFACLDPASSTNKSACYRAITVTGVDADNYWFLLDLKYGRWDSNETINQIFDVVVKYGLRNFYIEKGWYIQVIEPFLTKEMQMRNIFFNVVPLEHAKQGTKLERIKLLQPRFKAHTVYFPDKADWLSEIKSELAGVTKDEIKSEYIDCVDAFAMTEQVALPPVNSRQSYNESFERKKYNQQEKQSLFDIAGY
ncbi:MAG: phage terminase large subunit [Candidatus Gastranaerophilales bacterium]|nr:phage terminase large subunit [Candidatus Gastranaerophilales bacterium]